MLRAYVIALALMAAAFGPARFAQAQLPEMNTTKPEIDLRLFASDRALDLPLPFSKLDAQAALEDEYVDADPDERGPLTRFATADRGNIRFDTRRLAYERGPVDVAFPQLKGDYEVLRPHSRRYNCISWSLGISVQWIWPGDDIEKFDQLNGRYRYKRLGRLDLSHRPGTEKIALYAISQNGRLAVTHQARQMADGTWTSKLGQLPLIRHRTATAIDNASYGRPVAVYARSR
jgi:hypothetical protein